MSGRRTKKATPEPVAIERMARAAHRPTRLREITGTLSLDACPDVAGVACVAFCPDPDFDILDSSDVPASNVSNDADDALSPPIDERDIDGND